MAGSKHGAYYECRAAPASGRRLGPAHVAMPPLALTDAPLDLTSKNLNDGDRVGFTVVSGERDNHRAAVPLPDESDKHPPGVRHHITGTAPERRLSTRSSTIQPPPPISDTPDLQQLLEQAARGDERAFEALYRATSGRVYAVCVRMTADSDRARELTQDVFVRAWERIGSFRGESAVTSWLHRIAVNVVLEHERSTRRRLARVEERNDLAEVESAEGTARRSGSDDDRMDLEAAIAALPPATRRAFVLHDIEGYRHEEISRMTGTAQGTLRAQLFKARRMLMEALSR